MPLPRRRALDAFPVELKGEHYFVLRDTEGLLDDPMILDPFSFLVWNLLTGDAEVEDLQREISNIVKDVEVPANRILHIVERLQKSLLVESAEVEEHRRRIAEAFRSLRVRPARFAGRGGYSHEPKALTDEIDGYYKDKLGSGAPDRSKRGPLPRGILAPHIDFRRGGACYTHAYRPVAESEAPATVLVLGVAHLSPPSPFVLSDKAYETPLGPLEPDLDFIEKFRKRAPDGLMSEEFVHRSEHSIEFQAVFLRHSHPKADVKIVPILCSSFAPVEGGASPSTEARVEETIEALGEAVKSSGRRVLIVAGVDFAHVGPRFGDPEELDEKLVKWMTEGDSESLRHVAAVDAEGFWDSVMKDGNRRHVCGLTATYTALRLLKGAAGSLKRYAFAPDPAGGLVSFAAAVFS
jgi:AmmeMemoRadiSam system protein B